jgi:catechol-2,3-dioxygenase
MGFQIQGLDHGPAHSIYFEDPAGLRLELTTYEL